MRLSIKFAKIFLLRRNIYSTFLALSKKIAFATAAVYIYKTSPFKIMIMGYIINKRLYKTSFTSVFYIGLKSPVGECCIYFAKNALWNPYTFL